MSRINSHLRQSRLYPVLVLEKILAHNARKRLLKIGKILLFAIFYLAIVPYLFTTGTGGLFGATALDWLLTRLIGLFFVILAMLVPIYLLEMYFRSYYFGSIITNQYQSEDLFTFTVGRILYEVRNDDLLGGFLNSGVGRYILRRLGIFEEIVTVFNSSRTSAQATTLPKPVGIVLKLRELVEHIYKSDQNFVDFLFRQEIGLPELLGATDWVVAEIEMQARKECWWTRERLERVSGLAKDWAYGGIYVLEKYSRDLLDLPEGDIASVSVFVQEVKELETILARTQEANALVVAPPGGAKLEVMMELARQIKQGTVVPQLEHKRPVLLNSGVLLAAFKEKSALEQEIIKMLNEAVHAGNVFLVVDDLAALLLGTEVLGSNLLALLDPYLSSNRLQVVALADTDKFHQYLEPRGELMRRFEKVLVTEVDPARLMSTLEHIALRLESFHQIFFTYPGIVAAAMSAEQYFQTEATADKSTDLLIELVPWAAGHGKNVIGKAEVLEFVREKTNIPVGAIAGEEKERLLNLEELMHKRIIGQDAAIRAIASALRRSRTGIRNEKRPIGSFLFLGPTGVGKTETAKALAGVFFGREEAMMRLDMSEFSADDALNRLIGSFADSKAGILSNMLRQTSYGVLLLDEFEKTNREVLNLFLQILDEGFFSDAQGRRVNARNIIFIATSNAGADLVWKMVSENADLSTRRDELINHLVTSGAFRPELLNRFDDLIIFHPLSVDQLNEVAYLLLVRLGQRLRERGVHLMINQPLAEQVARLGSNRLFGARPMLRFIQDNIEEKIAEKMIRGEVGPGSQIEFDDKLTIKVSR